MVAKERRRRHHAVDGATVRQELRDPCMMVFSARPPATPANLACRSLLAYPGDSRGPPAIT